MIVWGGYGYNGRSYWELNDGKRYNPTADSWTARNDAGAPSMRKQHTAVWTGSEMIVWGGSSYDMNFGGGYVFFGNGGRYNPTTDRWTAVMNTNAPDGRSLHTAVWTGNEMIVWGGRFYDVSDHIFNDTWSYFPCTPPLQIPRIDSNSVVVAWPVWSTTLTLGQNSDLGTTNWITVTNLPSMVGSKNQVTVSPLTDKRFYQLFYP
jgi:hypothetical protein